MSNVFSISLPDDLSRFLKEKKDTSKYIQGILRKAREIEMNDAPALLKKEAEHIEQEINSLQTRRNIILNRLIIHLKQETVTKEEEKKKMRQLIEDSRKRKRENIDKAKTIPDIDKLLGPAIGGNANFDYIKAVGVIWTKNPSMANKIDVSCLKAYVESKQGGKP